jgi:hypothetical protein
VKRLQLKKAAGKAGFKPAARNSPSRVIQETRTAVYFSEVIEGASDGLGKPTSFGILRQD